MNAKGNANLLSKYKREQAPIKIPSNIQKMLNSNKSKPIKAMSNSAQISQGNKKDMTQLEEEIYITVPTPYPQAQYMTIDDPNLLNSEYSNVLNDKYPPRKYLKHNQQSWNKIVKPKSTDIKFSFMNPKLKFSDYNLKVITYKNEEIGEAKLTNLDEAQELVDKLKAKLIEYELTNNSNIEHANEIIDKYKELVEDYKRQLNDLYTKLESIGRKYDIDIDYLDENDPYSIMSKGFRKRWLIRNFMNAFVSRITRQKIIRFEYEKYKNRMNIILKLKGFISLEKNQTMTTFTKAIIVKRQLEIYKNIFSSLKFNKMLNRLKNQFFLVQKNMIQLLYLKELKLRAYQKKNYQTKNHKALLFYYKRVIHKTMRALHRNCIRNMKKSDINNNHSNSKINYSKFTSALGNVDKKEKEMKVKGMSLIKKLINQMTVIQNKKVSHNDNQYFILIHYFREWKRGSKENEIAFKYNMILRNNMLKLFFKAVMKISRRKNYNITLHNSKIKQLNAKGFFKTVKRILTINQKKTIIKARRVLSMKKYVIYKIQSLIIDNPKIHFNRIRRKLVYSSLIDSLRYHLQFNKKSKSIAHSKKYYINQMPFICRKIFFIVAKIRIIPQRLRIKKLNAIVLHRIISQTLHALFIKAYTKKQNSLRSYYENTILNIKTILTEKSGMINQLEFDNQDLVSHCGASNLQIQALASENKMLRQTMYEEQYKHDNEIRRFQVLIEQNSNDVKSLQMTIQNNENMLSEAIKREEHLQNKYVVDIQTAVKMNKNLNEIITRKNQQLLDVNMIKRREAEEEQIEKEKISQLNSTMYNSLTYTIQQKEYEKQKMTEEKNKQLQQTNVLLEHYQKEKQQADKKNTQLMTENKLLISKVNIQPSISHQQSVSPPQ